MSKVVKMWCICIFLVYANFSFAGQTKGKLIEFGWDMPDIPFLVKHIERLEKLPFDGVVIDLGRRNTWSGAKKRKSGLAWNFWQAASMNTDLRTRVNEDISLLSTLKPGVFKDSFIQVNAHPGGVDWYNEAGMKNVIENWRLVAKAVKKLGFKGIFFDIEAYTSGAWNYHKLVLHKKACFEVYQQQVFKCAKEIMKVIQAECPEMTILFTGVNEMVYYRNKQRTQRYELLPSFFDGFLAAAGDGIVLVDGYEASYGFREAVQFENARNLILSELDKTSKYPELYRQKINVGFALFVDLYSRALWHTNPKDFDKNFYTPDELAFIVHQGLKYGDYVWIYTQKINWWTGQYCPAEYISALARAKSEDIPVPPKRDLSRVKTYRVPPMQETARLIYKQDDYSIMTPVWKDYRTVINLPGIWQFKPDSKNIGEKEKWFAPKTSNTGWKPIVVPEWWNYKSSKWYDYSGVGWYQVDFKVPEWAKGKKLVLYFAGVDESAKVWVNGKCVGEHNLGYHGATIPFRFDVTKFIYLDKPNRLVVRVYGGIEDSGGIWRSVNLITPVK